MSKRIMFVCLLTFFLFNCSSSNQGKGHLNKNVSLIETFELESYTKPRSILFYAQGHSEFNKYYESLTEKIRRRLNKTEIRSDYVIKLDRNNQFWVDSFDDINVDFNDEKFDVICVFHIGKSTKKSSGKSGYDPNRIIYHTLYVKVFETGTNKVLIKKKFEVESELTILTQNRKLSNAILNELKLL